METYAEIQEKIAELSQRAILAQKEERAKIIAEIRQKMIANNITLRDVQGRSTLLLTGTKRQHPSKGKKAPIKYRHPKTGQTWSGRGIYPKWLSEEIAKGKPIEKFAV